MSDNTDFFDNPDAENENTPEFTKNRIANLVREVRTLDSEIAVLDEKMKVLKGRKDDIETKKIPDALLEAGLSEIVTAEGLKVTTKLSVGAIPKEKKPEAFAWMDSHGHSSLIKRAVSISFDKGSSEAASRAKEAIQALGFEPKETLDVHHQTWSSFAKEQTLKGVALPFEAWGVFVGQRAVIK